MFNLKACGIAAALVFIISLLTGVIVKSSFPAFILRPVIFGVVFFVLSALINMIVGHYLPELLDGSAPNTAGGDTFSMPGEHINFTEEAMPEGEVITGSVPVLNAAVADDADGNLGDISSIDDNSYSAEDGGSTGSFDESSGIDAAKSGNGGFVPMPIETASYKTKDSGGLDQNSTDDYNATGGSDNFSFGLEDFSGGSVAEAKPTQKAKSTAAVGQDSMDILPDLDGMAKAFSYDSGSGNVGNVMEEADSYSGSTLKKSAASKKGEELSWDFNPKDMAQGIRTKISKEG